MDSDISDNISFLGDNCLEYFQQNFVGKNKTTNDLIEYPTITENITENGSAISNLSEKMASKERDNDSAISNSKNTFSPNKLNINSCEQFMIIETTPTKKRKKRTKVSNSTILNKKRGRKIKSENKNKRNSHTRNDPCNIRSRITRKYFKFLINFINAIIIQLLIQEDNVQEYKLKKIKYNENINIDNIQKLKDKTIREIVSYDISGKYKSSKNNQNKINENDAICERIIEKRPEIEKIMNLKYMKFFDSVFCGEKKTVDLNEYGINIQVPLNSDIELYQDCIKNIKKKEENSGDLEQYLKKMNKCIIDYKTI